MLSPEEARAPVAADVLHARHPSSRTGPKSTKMKNSERNANISVHVEDTPDRLDVQDVRDRDVTEPEEKRRRVDNPS